MKAQQATTYTIIQVYSALALKTHQSSTYTQTDVNHAFGTTTYKSEMAIAFGGQAHVDYV